MPYPPASRVASQNSCGLVLPCRNTATATADTWRELLGACQQLRQLRNIRSNAPRFIPREHFCRRSPPRLILEIDIAERCHYATTRGTCPGIRRWRPGELQ
jgi:hypothetical protein